MSVDTASRAEWAKELRNVLVDEIIADHAAKGLVMRADVERAMQKVPRDLVHPRRPAGGGVRGHCGHHDPAR
ncbi:MAG: hypothetical protein ACRDTC_18465 [Pseudonocardiaceae bacterium]